MFNAINDLADLLDRVLNYWSLLLPGLVTLCYIHVCDLLTHRSLIFHTNQQEHVDFLFKVNAQILLGFVI